MGPPLVAGCQAFALAAAGPTGGVSLGLFPLCPVLIPLMFYAMAPMGSDIFMAFILASLIGGLNKCGCVPLKCQASARLKSNVCALYHAQEKEMLNEYHFVPPPGEKCVPTRTGCGMQKCNQTEVANSQLGWIAQPGKVWGHSVGIYNCMKGDFDDSDTSVTSRFNYKTFMDKHPDWKELKTNMVPQVQAPTKLSALQKWTVGLPQGIRKCLGMKGIKRLLAPACFVKKFAGTLISWAMDMVEKFLNFIINTVLAALKLVRFVFFTIKSVITRDLGSGRLSWGQCDKVEQEQDREEEGSLLELGEDFYEPIEDRFGLGSLCMQGAVLRPCGEVDLSEHYL